MLIFIALKALFTISKMSCIESDIIETLINDRPVLAARYICYIAIALIGIISAAWKKHKGQSK